MKARELETCNLILKRLTIEFCTEEYVGWMNDNTVIQYLESGGDYTIGKLYNFLLEQEKKDILFWAVIEKQTNKHIGNIKIDPINVETNSGEYGIMIGDRGVWGRGYAKEASIAVIEYCFSVLDLEEITLGVISENKKAKKLYDKLGFRVYKEILKEIQGKETLIYRMRLLRNESV